MNESIDKIIIRCPSCKQKLRLPLFRDKKLLVKCPRCTWEFRFNSRKYIVMQEMTKWGVIFLCGILVIVDIVVPFVLKYKLTTDIAKIKRNYEESIKQIDGNFLSEIIALKNKYTEEIQKINRDKLRETARLHYAKIWQERKSYDNRFAVSPREKALLEMLKLSKDKTKTEKEIIKSIAVKAAPKNSTVNVGISYAGILLDIDFDMSELTSGEEGTRTKHYNVDSLKQEVIRLISKVTKDVYEFCQDLELETVTIGCKHFVRLYDRNKYDSAYLGDQSIVLYKVRLDKKNIKELGCNPFLDIYSTTKYFKVVEDEFPTLDIERIYEK